MGAADRTAAQGLDRALDRSRDGARLPGAAHLLGGGARLRASARGRTSARLLADVREAGGEAKEEGLIRARRE